jgi:tRNA/tmRNA/rRNA uracil-C5-methylase (TrmA/RlmC/RlmD family)
LLECTHRPPCAGCPRFGEPGIAAPARAALDRLASEHGLPGVRVHSGSSRGFRLRARLAIRGRAGAPKIGLFELDSHRVVTVPNCVVQHPLINEVSATVRRALAETRTTCYSDAAHLGLARHLQVVVERDTQRAQVVLVANADGPEPLREALELIRERLGDRLHSLWFNANTDRTNRILGPRFVNWCGPEAVIERYGGAAVHYPPGAFGQSNLEVAEQIVAHVRERVPEGAAVAEFHAGVGAIGLSIVHRVRELRVNEVAPDSLHGLELGLAGLEAADRAKVTLHPGTAAERCEIAAGADVVIADPPRKGLEPELVTALVAAAPRRFVYVSCGLESFLQDAQRLTASGALRLTELAAFNLMPYTEHVETVACFERAS